jgi:hypothetical protein
MHRLPARPRRLSTVFPVGDNRAFRLLFCLTHEGSTGVNPRFGASVTVGSRREAPPMTATIDS